VRPPTFVVFTSGGKPGLHFSYERYLLNRLREEFDFFASPLRAKLTCHRPVNFPLDGVTCGPEININKIVTTAIRISLTPACRA